MAVVLGTSSGFVRTAPTADPNGGATTTIDGSSVVTKDTTPANASKITEVGWYRAAGTNTANFEIALYADTAGVAAARLYVDATNSSSSAGWIVTAVDWSVSGNTSYWLAVQMDAHSGSSSIDRETSGGAGYDVLTSQSALADPYGGGAVADADGLMAIYALVKDRLVTLATATATATGIAATPSVPTLDKTVVLDPATLTATGVSASVSAPAPAQTVVLDTALLWFSSSTRREIDLSTAVLTVTGIPVTPSIVTAATVTLSTASITGTPVSITLDLPDVSVQDVALYYPAKISLDTASLTGTPIPASVDAPITRTLDTAALTGTPIPLTISAPAPGIDITLSTAAITASGVALSVDAPISRTLSTSSLTAAGIGIKIGQGIPLGTGAASVVGVGLSVSAPGPATTITLSTASLTGTGIGLDVVPGAVARTLQTAQVTATGIPLTLSAIPPGLAITLGTATATATGIPLTVSAVAPALSVSLDTASLTATPIAIADVTAYPSWWLPVSVTATVGSVVSGTIADTWSDNATKLRLAETTGTPGFTYDFNWYSVPLTGTNQVNINGFYAGNPAHNVKIQQYNFTTTTWVDLTADSNDFPSASSDQDYYFHVNNDTDYNSSGNIQLRLTHTSAGNITHNLYIDYFALELGWHVLIDTAVITGTGIGIDVVPGAVSTLLDTASVTGTGVSLTVSAGGAPQTVALGTASLTATGVSLTVKLGQIITLDTATLTATPVSNAIVAGATVSLSTASLTLAPEDLTVIEQQYIAMATAVLVATAVSIGSVVREIHNVYERRTARYYTPMLFEEIDESGIKRAKFWLFEDGTEIMWGTK